MQRIPEGRWWWRGCCLVLLRGRGDWSLWRHGRCIAEFVFVTLVVIVIVVVVVVAFANSTTFRWQRNLDARSWRRWHGWLILFENTLLCVNKGMFDPSPTSGWSFRMSMIGIVYLVTCLLSYNSSRKEGGLCVSAPKKKRRLPTNTKPGKVVQLRYWLLRVFRL